jgi:methyl-accepting chemotaxis protein
MVILIIIGAAFTSVGVYGGLSKELKYFAGVSQKMASGDLTQRVNINVKDPIGDLSRNFDNAIEIGTSVFTP